MNPVCVCVCVDFGIYGQEWLCSNWLMYFGLSYFVRIIRRPELTVLSDQVEGCPVAQQPLTGTHTHTLTHTHTHTELVKYYSDEVIPDLLWC